MVGCCEHSNEHLCFMEQWGFLEYLQKCWLLTKGSAALNKSVSQLVLELFDYLVSLAAKSRFTRS